MSNWQKLKRKLDCGSSDSTKIDNRSKKSRYDLKAAVESKKVISAPIKRSKLNDKYVGLDCEMVGTGLTGKDSALARCSLVNYDEEVIYDKFVRPAEYITDFRTKYSGIRRKDMRVSKTITLAECQKEVSELLKGKILVGHALHNDLKVLMLSHSRFKMRDTARYRPYMRPHGKKGGKFKPRALKDLVRQHLKEQIQQGEHDSCIDARAAMRLYKLKQTEWEASLREKKVRPSQDNSQDTQDSKEDNSDEEDAEVEVDDNADEEDSDVDAVPENSEDSDDNEIDD